MEQEPGADDALAGHVPRPRARDEPDAGGGGGAARGGHRRGAAALARTPVGWAHHGVLRDRHRGAAAACRPPHPDAPTRAPADRLSVVTALAWPGVRPR